MGRHAEGQRVPPTTIVQPRVERSSPALVAAADEAIKRHEEAKQSSKGSRRHEVTRVPDDTWT